MKDYKPVMPPPGVVRGASKAVLPNRYADANLIRWRNGVMQPIGGNQRMTASPLPSIPRRLLVWTDNNNVTRVGIMADTKIHVLEATTYTAVEPLDYVGWSPGTGGGYGIYNYGAEDYGDARSVGSVIATRPPMWSLDTWGEDIVFLSSSDGRLLNWSPTTPGSRAAALSGAPTGNRAFVVTPERHILVCGARGDRRRLEWCAREDRNDWNFASTTNTAGFLPTDSSGWHSALYEVREGSLLLCDDEVWLVRYVGQPYIYGAEKINDTVDFLSPRAVATYNGKAAWMGQQGFWRYEGGQVRPIQCDVAELVFGDINRNAATVRAHASANGTFNELWWFYPSAGATECDRYVVWHPDEGWWSIGAMSRSAMFKASVYDTPIAAGNDGALYLQEQGWTDAGTPRTGMVWAETGALSIDNGSRAGKVLLAELDGGGAYEAIRMRAYARRARMGAEQAFGPYTPRVDGYTEMRFEGRDIRLRFEAARDEAWSVGACRLDVRPGSGR
jgi:hypothetical protein